MVNYRMPLLEYWLLRIYLLVKTDTNRVMLLLVHWNNIQTCIAFLPSASFIVQHNCCGHIRVQTFTKFRSKHLTLDQLNQFHNSNQFQN